MNDFSLWFVTGLEHIVDVGAYDHILFVSLLALAYPPGEWKKLFILVTAFTFGHSLSLATVVIQGLNAKQSLIESLIAASILFTAVYQLFSARHSHTTKTLPLFIAVVFFGLFHGLGFSFLLQSMLGGLESRFLPLLYFNLGIEAGQLIIVSAVCLFSLFLARVLNIQHNIYQPVFLWTILLFALYITAQRCVSFFLG